MSSKLGASAPLSSAHGSNRASTHGWSRSPPARRWRTAARGLSLRVCPLRPRPERPACRGCCRSSRRCSAILVVASAVQTEPRPALHGRGLAVPLVLVAFVVAGSRRHDLPPRSRRPAHAAAGCWPAIGACSLALALLQPDGAGLLGALHHARHRLRAARAAPGDPRLSRSASCASARCTRRSAATELGGQDRDRRRQRGDLLLHGLPGAAVPGRPGARASGWSTSSRRRARRRPRRSRCASARGSRARCTTCSRTRSRRSPSQLEGARLLARSRGADPERGRRRRAQPPPREGRPRGGAARRSRRCAAATCPGPTGCGALADEFREQTGVDDGARARRRAARAAVRGAPGGLPDGAGGADERAPPCRPRRGRAAPALRRRRHLADGRGPRPRRRRHPASRGSGYGLTGMRERAELLGGRLAAAPTADGFRVELYLPA